MSEWSVSTTQTRVIIMYDEESPVSSGMQHVSMKWAQRLRGLSWRAGSFWADYLEIQRLCFWAARNKPPPTYLIKTQIFFYWFRRTEHQFPLTDKNSPSDTGVNQLSFTGDWQADHGQNQYCVTLNKGQRHRLAAEVICELLVIMLS